MGSGNCTADSSGDLLCTATSSAPAPATDTWTIYTYATTSPIVGTTTPLSIYTGYVLPVTVAGPNLASVATFGVPAALVFPPSSVNLVAIDSFFTQTTSVQVQDAGGATIIGGDNFSDANGNTGSVQFTGCDTHLTPTPSTFIASNQTALAAQSTISVAYDNAGSVGTTLHCSATALGGLTAQYSVNLIAPSITESTIPTANSNPIDITAGPDGALWFTEYGGNKIGRITTSGNITEFPLPGNPIDITAWPGWCLMVYMARWGWEDWANYYGGECIYIPTTYRR